MRKGNGNFKISNLNLYPHEWNDMEKEASLSGTNNKCACQMDFLLEYV